MKHLFIKDYQESQTIESAGEKIMTVADFQKKLFWIFLIVSAITLCLYVYLIYSKPYNVEQLPLSQHSIIVYQQQ